MGSPQALNPWSVTQALHDAGPTSRPLIPCDCACAAIMIETSATSRRLLHPVISFYSWLARSGREQDLGSSRIIPERVSQLSNAESRSRDHRALMGDGGCKCSGVAD